MNKLLIVITTVLMTACATILPAGNLVTEGLDDPHIDIPYVYPGKAGFYGGAMLGQSTTTSQRTVIETHTWDGGDYFLGPQSDWPSGWIYNEGDYSEFFGNPTLNALPNKSDIAGPNCNGMTVNCATGTRDADGNATEVWVLEDYTFEVDRYEEPVEVDQGFVGLFAGYRDYVYGGFMVGAEVSSYITEDEQTTLSGEGVLSYDFTDLVVFTSVGGVTRDGMDGWTAGVGADYYITESAFVGAKYSQNQFEDYDVSDENIALRIGWSFN